MRLSFHNDNYNDNKPSEAIKNMKAYEVEQAERGTDNWVKLGWDYVSLDKAEAKKWASKRGAEYTGLKHRVVTITATESQIKTYGL